MGRDPILLSYDVSGSVRSVAARVCQIVFGRSRTTRDGRVYEEEGLVHRPGVVWVGQSVLILERREAQELARRLRRLGVRVALASVAVSRASVEAFRRGT